MGLYGGEMSMRQKVILLAFIVALSFQSRVISAEYEYLFNEQDTIMKDISFYGGFTHQHHDFFNNAFSFQGVEAGFIFNNSVIAGLYGSAFVNNLEVFMSYKTMYFSMAQAGIALGYINDFNKFLHTGFLLNMGYISISGDDKSFGLFSPDNPQIDIGAFVISPQVYAELNILKWMKIRTGLSYNFYSYEDHTIIKTEDLQNISFTFAVLFGRFY